MCKYPELQNNSWSCSLSNIIYLYRYIGYHFWYRILFTIYLVLLLCTLGFIAAATVVINSPISSCHRRLLQGVTQEERTGLNMENVFDQSSCLFDWRTLCYLYNTFCVYMKGTMFVHTTLFYIKINILLCLGYSLSP